MRVRIASIDNFYSTQQMVQNDSYGSLSNGVPAWMSKFTLGLMYTAVKVSAYLTCIIEP